MVMRSVAPTFPDEVFQDLSTMAAEAARQRPEHAALIFEGETIPWGEFDRRVNQIAHSLIRLGLKPTEKVAILAHTCPEYVQMFMGTLRAGGCAVPLSSMASGETLEMMINDSDARVLLVSESMYPAIADFSARLANILPNGLIALDFDAPGWTRFDAWLAGAPSDHPGIPIEPDYPFNIIYSSGTTGVPKGILHDHRMRFRQMKGTLAFGVGPDSVALVSTPYYSNTTLVTALTVIAQGGTQVLMRKFDAEGFLQLAEQYRVTDAMLVPVQYQRILSHPNFDRYDLSSFRAKFSTSAPLRGKVLRDALDRWPGKVYEIYGLTEGGVRTFLDAAAFPDKLDSVGRPSPGVDIRIIDEDGKELPPGEIGEIVGRSGAMMVGYYKRDDLTQAMYWESPEGEIFYKTGDMGRFDEDGFLYLLDRKKDMIISGGENIYCAEVENVIAGHPRIREVAVIGRKDDKWGEVPVAVLALNDEGADLTLDELNGWLRDKLAGFKLPKHLVHVEELPRNASGKVVKGTLRSEHGSVGV